MSQKVHPLTPREQTNVKETVYKAWLDEQAIYTPPPEPDDKDLVHENPWVVRILTGAVAFVPLLLGIIMVAAIFISSDKTMRAFHDAVAMKDALWGVWGVAIAFFAVVMVEGGLVFSEFGAVRERLKKGLKREVITLPGLLRGLAVRLGGRPGWHDGRLTWVHVEPLDYSEMPDMSLAFFSKFIFLLVILANTYGVLYAYTGDNGQDIMSLDTQGYFELALFVIIGLAGAISLRLIGSQLAHMTYELVAQDRVRQQQAMYEAWRQMMNERWAQEGQALVDQALHRKFLSKNGLPLEAGSPYLLTAGEDGALEPVPFEPSSPPLLMTSGTRSNGHLSS